MVTIGFSRRAYTITPANAPQKPPIQRIVFITVAPFQAQSVGRIGWMQLRALASNYHLCMDKVRFGRALGKGAKSLWEAADAATSPDPNAKPRPTESPAAHAVLDSVAQAHRVVTHTKQQAREAGLSAARPVLANAKRLSSVLWLEITGSFFAIFALGLGTGVWKSRHALAQGSNSDAAHKLYLFATLFAAFAYFAISSFVRARRRERQ